MTMWPDLGVTVNRLRVARGDSDALAVRLRADRALSQAVVRLSALPPSAILCVRKVADPRPRSVVLHRDQPAAPEWIAAVSSSLTRIASNATRPVAGVIASDAEAVLFADRSELLACLAADWCDGRLGARWWWRVLFADAHCARRVIEAWLSAPRHVAPALELLTRYGLGPAFAARLSESQTSALLDAVLRVHGYRESLPVWPRVKDAPPGGSASNAVRRRLDQSSVPSRTPPWLTWVQECVNCALRLDQERLLGLSVTIQRAPARVVTAAFIETALAWRPRDERIEGATESATVPPAAAPLVSPERRLPRRVKGAVESPPLGGSAAVPSIPPHPAQEPAIGRDAKGLELSSEARPANAAERSGEPAAFALETCNGSVLPIASASSTAGLESIATEFGGVFLLLNLGIGLGLYGDFTAPAQPGIALPIWDFVAIVGRRLAGAAITADSIWGLLAGLARRLPNEAPGKGFDAPRSWRVTAEWLRPFSPAGTWRWSASTKRLRVRHPAGFLVLDVQRTDEATGDQVRREAAAYSALTHGRLRRQRPSTHLTRRRSPLAQWSAWLLPYVRARLSAAMAGARASATGPLLCRQAARVVVSPAHLHVAFSLGALPIEVRLSGLDRDPGWIPAAGRTVTFAFE
jgi:hypothetical protein